MSIVVEPYKMFYIEKEHKRSYRLPNNSIVNLELGVPRTAVDLFKSGTFDYLRLKKGAEVLFNDLSEEEILTMIERSKYPSDIKVLAKLVTTAEGKKRVSHKLKTFKNS